MTAATVLLLQLLCLQTAQASEYKLIKQQGNTSLYERWIPHPGEDVRELKAVFTVNAGIDKIISLLQNQQLGMQWNKNASRYKIVRSGKSNEWITYIRYDMPMMMDDQECCLSYTVSNLSSNNGTGYVVTFSSTTSALFPVHDGIKRITGIRGKWLLERIDDNKVSVTYIISSDRNKNIPRFVSDPIIRDNLFKTMNNFKSLAEK
jgi:hypothetical protein